MKVERKITIELDDEMLWCLKEFCQSSLDADFELYDSEHVKVKVKEFLEGIKPHFGV